MSHVGIAACDGTEMLQVAGRARARVPADRRAGGRERRARHGRAAASSFASLHGARSSRSHRVPIAATGHPMFHRHSFVASCSKKPMPTILSGFTIDRAWCLQLAGSRCKDGHQKPAESESSVAAKKPSRLGEARGVLGVAICCVLRRVLSPRPAIRRRRGGRSFNSVAVTGNT